MMTKNKKRFKKQPQKPVVRRFMLLLLGVGAFQIIAALLATILWLLGINWQSHVIVIAGLSIVLTIPSVLLLRNNLG